MTVEFQRENFSAVAREAIPLMRQHWREIALYQNRVPLEPNFEYYFAHERTGNFILLTARSNGVLVGYIANMVGPHPHYMTTIWANNDLFWLDPAYRAGMTGVKLFLKMDELLKSLGVKVNNYIPKLHFEKERGGVQKILLRLGYEPIGMQLGKYIGE